MNITYPDPRLLCAQPGEPAIWCTPVLAIASEPPHIALDCGHTYASVNFTIAHEAVLDGEALAAKLRCPICERERPQDATPTVPNKPNLARLIG